jgi:hypothetical protein
MKTPFFVQARRPGGQTSRPKGRKVCEAAPRKPREASSNCCGRRRDAHGATRQGDGVGNVDHSPAVALDEGEGPDRAAGRLRRLDRGAMTADFEGDADVLASTSTPCAPWLKPISSYGQRSTRRRVRARELMLLRHAVGGSAGRFANALAADRQHHLH